MAVRTLSPRLPSDEPTRPVFPRGRKPTWLVGLVAVFAILPVVIAVVDDRLGLRLVMAALAVTILGAAVCLHVLFGTIRDRTLRVDDTAPGLWFRPAAAATAVPFVLGALLVLPAVAQVVADAAELETLDSFLLTRGPYAIALLGLGVVVVTVVRLREPAGLRLTPAGLVGIRGRGRVQWGWDDLETVDVGSGPVAMLTLVPAGGGPRVEAPPLALGGDPNQVATVVRYFRAHPGERALLTAGGPDAVRAVDDALRARER